ncbi:hypothetical protein FRB96_002663 [Tulasnella sp. 330]|nr:hypothetical protein FRB96_002663 [Tulasnella sp. 330]
MLFNAPVRRTATMMRHRRQGVNNTAPTSAVAVNAVTSGSFPLRANSSTKTAKLTSSYHLFLTGRYISMMEPQPPDQPQLLLVNPPTPTPTPTAASGTVASTPAASAPVVTHATASAPVSQSTAPKPSASVVASNPSVSAAASATPSSALPVTPSQSSALPTSASTPPTTSALVPTTAPTTTALGTSITPTTQPIPVAHYTSYTTTDAAGQTYTVTGLISTATGADGASGNSTSSTSFFQNKGAVAAIFVIAGLAGTALFLVGLIVLVRRHRARQFEKEAALTAADAAMTTKRPPSEYDEDDMARAPALGTPEMIQKNVGGVGAGSGYGNAYTGAYGAPGGRSAYGENPFDNGRNIGYGPSTVAAAVVGAGAARTTRQRERGNSPPPTDYYNNAPYATGNANSGYPPQPIPAYSHSSHGGRDDSTAYSGKDELDEYAGGARWEAPYSQPPLPQQHQQQYGQAQSRGVVAGAGRNGPSTSPGEMGEYASYGTLYEDDEQQYPSPASERLVESTSPPKRGGPVPITKQNMYTPPAPAAAAGGRPAHNSMMSEASQYTDYETSPVPPMPALPATRGGGQNLAPKSYGATLQPVQRALSARRRKGDSDMSDMSYYGNDNFSTAAGPQRVSVISEASSYGTVNQQSYQNPRQGPGQQHQQTYVSSPTPPPIRYGGQGGGGGDSAVSQESSGYGSYNLSAYGRDLTPRPSRNGGQLDHRRSAASGSVYDDGASAMSYYSDEEDPRITAGLGPKRSLRIANE